MKIMGYEVFTDKLDTIELKKKQVINTINPHSYITAKSDSLFQEALMDSDFLIPDGSGIVIAAKVLNNSRIKKIAGADLHHFLLDKMNGQKGKVFYMGSSQNTLDRIKKKLTTEYPNVIMQSYSPPFKPQFTQQENDTIVSLINDFNPNVLFVGMTAPKQEKWLHTNKDKLNFNVASSIGAVFDFYAGTIKRPSKIWIDLHLEWLPRFLNEPKRLWRRNFVSTPLFLWDMLKFKLKNSQ